MFVFPKKLVVVPEHETQNIESIIHTLNPSALFFDTLCTASSIPMVQIERILTAVKTSSSKPFLVLDNTGRSITFQPFKTFSHLLGSINLLCWESLLKHHQFGMDRVNAGILYGRCKDQDKIYDYRDHLGTNLPDIACLSLPHPNKKILLNRLFRHERNALFIGQKLSQAIKNQKEMKIETVIYPALPSHVENPWISAYSFHGSFLTLKFFKKFETVSVYTSLLTKILSLAKKQQIPILGGTSFGLPQTRIYIPAIRPGAGEPFFRISVGLESLLITSNIANILTQVIEG